MNQLIFIGGMSRSGANLLGNILDSHPEVACGPDTGIIDEIAYLYLSLISGIRSGRTSQYTSEEEIRSAIAAMIRGIYSTYGAKKGKRIVVDRTANNIWSFSILGELLPEAKFIHLVRDGRDIACSQRDVGDRMRAAGHDITTTPDATLRSVYHCAAVWAETVRFGWDTCGPDSQLAAENRSFTTFYENIVMSPESQIRNICDFIGVPFSVAMLSPERHAHDLNIDNIWTMKEVMESSISMLSAGRWIDHLSLTDRILFYARGHVGLRITGYDESVEWLFRGMNLPVDKAAQALEEARANLLGLAEESKGAQKTAGEASPARLTIEQIINTPVMDGTALGKPLPEIDALLRSVQQSGRMFVG
jgi:protein-tyrosine sulfotransferase